jgi:hypothetical protein
VKVCTVHRVPAGRAAVGVQQLRRRALGAQVEVQQDVAGRRHAGARQRALGQRLQVDDGGGVAGLATRGVEHGQHDFDAGRMARVLGDLEQAGKGGAAAGAGALESLRDLAVDAHVQAEGPFVAMHRFEIVDDVVAGPARRRQQPSVLQFAQAGVGQDLFQAGFERGAVRVLDQPVEIERPDIRRALQQRHREVVELRPRYRLHRRKQAVGDIQYFDAVFQSLSQCRHAHIDTLFERHRLFIVLEAAHGGGQDGAGHESTAEREGACKRE